MLPDLLGNKSKLKMFLALAASSDWQFNLSALAQRAGLDKGSVSRLIKEFERAGLVEVQRSGKLLIFKLQERYRALAHDLLSLEKKWK